MKRFITGFLIAAAVVLAGCGQKVEVPPAHVGKVMTKNGYQEGTIGTSKFRLDPCWAYCDKLVVLDQSDKTKAEPLAILMPEDKLNIQVSVQSTLSVNPKKVEALFNTIPPVTPDGSEIARIDWDTIYKTYAQQIIQSETREVLSKYTIAHLASNMETVTAQLRQHLTRTIEQRTPFTVRYVGLANIKYPDIITKAQEGAAKRREEIQTEEAQLQISKVKLERELQEARLTRQIEFEKAQTEAAAFKTQAASITPEVLKKQELDNQAAWIAKWNGQLPDTVTADIFSTFNKAAK